MLKSIKIGLFFTTLLAPATAMADMQAQLLPPWSGKTIPAGQHCTLYGGKGSTPPMQVTGIPAGAVWIIGYFNDKDYRPLSRDGGHGTIGWPVRGSAMQLAPVPGMTDTLPNGARVIKKSRAGGKFASPGYLPPCSGGKGNRYSVDLVAIDAKGRALDKVSNLIIGRY